MIEKKVKIKDLEISYKYYPPMSPLVKGGDFVFLILHGWGGSSDSWVKVSECLAKDHEIYALDFPFFGKSDDLRESWRVDNYVEMVEEFVRVVIPPLAPPCKGEDRKDDNCKGGDESRRINLVAHSFGGRVAIKLAAKNPEWISKVFLCDVAGIKHALTMKQKLAGVVARGWRRAAPNRKGSFDSPKNFLENFFDSLRMTAYRMIGSCDYYTCKNEIMRETFKNVIAEDLTNCLDKIKIPAAIIWGDKDKYTPLADGKLMNEKIKGSDLYVIKGAGHGVHLHAPAEVCRIIQRRIATD